MEDAKDQIENDKHEIDHKTGNSVGEGDNKEGEKDLGDSGLESGDVLGVDLHPEHDHKAVKNEDEDEDKIGNIAEGAPNGKNWDKILETETGPLGVSRFD